MAYKAADEGVYRDLQNVYHDQCIHTAKLDQRLLGRGGIHEIQLVKNRKVGRDSTYRNQRQSEEEGSL